MTSNAAERQYTPEEEKLFSEIAAGRTFDKGEDLPPLYRKHLINLLWMQGDSEYSGALGYMPWIERAPDVKEKVLVVDDELDVLELLEFHLESEYSVTSVTSPTKAMKLLRNEDFDLLVTDLQMPGVSGESLIKLAKDIKKQMRLIVVSGYLSSVPALAQNSGRFSRVQVFPKPLPKKKDFLDAIREPA